MKTIYIQQPHEELMPSVATIGFFDGVHRGHQYLMSQLVEAAARQSLQSTVITFDRHPRQVLGSDYQPQLLTTIDEKLERLALTGVDNCVVLSFTPALASLSAHDFMTQVLHDQLHARQLYIGYDNRFGHNRTEGFADYVRYGAALGMDVIQSTAMQIEGINVSSSVVRSFISEGEVEMATRCLGYHYTVSGRVVDGFHEGRQLGFPTANLQTDDPCKLIPAPGVYAVKVSIGQSAELLPAMMNIGRRPTFGNNFQLTLEVHIINFSGNLYGQRLSVQFVQRLRNEQKFQSIQALRRQLLSDEKTVSEYLEAKQHQEK